MRFATTGTRNISTDTIDTLKSIGFELAQRGHTVVEGNAPGSEQAFAVGASRAAPTSVVTHLPWAGYESHALQKGFEPKLVSVPDFELLAATHHSSWKTCTQGTKQLFSKNAAMVADSDFVISYDGGCAENSLCAHATRVAIGLGKNVLRLEKVRIPIFDITNRIQELVLIMETSFSEGKKDLVSAFLSAAQKQNIKSPTVGRGFELLDEEGAIVRLAYLP